MSRLNRVVVAAVLAIAVMLPSAGGVVGAHSQPAPRHVCTKVGDVVSAPVPLVCKQTVNNGLRWRKAPITTTTTTSTTTMPIAPSTTVAVVPSVSLAATFLDSGTFPKAAMVTTNVAGTVYFVEGASPVNTVSDITSARNYRWTSGVVAANTPTSIALDVDVLTNGYYRVFVANSQGMLSAPAFNQVTISITRQAESVAVRRQTLDQSDTNFSDGCHSVSLSSTKGQSFVAGTSGPLSRVSAGIIKSNSVTQVTATIYAWSGTAVIGSALASKTVLETAVPSYTGCNSTPTALVNFDFATPASVTSGSQYIIVLTTPDQEILTSGGEFGWNTSTTSTTGGFNDPVSSPSASGSRYLFQTYVDI